MEVVGPLQIRVLHYLWTHGESTVPKIHAFLNVINRADGHRLVAYTTVLTVMRNLVRRGVLTQTTTGRAHVFAPRISRDEYSLNILQLMRAEVFQGDTYALLATLGHDSTLPVALRNELTALAKMKPAD